MGTWKSPFNQPGFNASTMLLQTGGTIMCGDKGPAALGGSLPLAEVHLTRRWQGRQPW